MIDIIPLNQICSDALRLERESQREDGGRFASRTKATLASVNDGEMTRRVTDYVSPKGSGYVVTFHFEKDGKRWRRVVNVGPERHRDISWFEEVKPTSRRN